MIIKRHQSIEQSRAPGRVLIIYGPRRVGKTTLLKQYLERAIEKRVLFATGDDMRIREIFGKGDRDALLAFASPYDLIAIDEAQQVSGIGLGTKMLIDSFPEKEILLTGSSSFDLSNQVGEPLTGRHYTLTLLPIALREQGGGAFELHGALESFLRYGSYPEVLSARDNMERERILTELVSSYLYKDVLALDRIKSPDVLRDITRALAFQVGSEVSHHEIAQLVHVDPKTVARYLDLLEKMFIIKRVSGYSRNLRNEISKKAKYYFLDCGVRNAVIGQFNALGERSDVGALWENFVFTELLKRSTILDWHDAFYFWRTHSGKEIDIIREQGAALFAYECKFGTTQSATPPLWQKTYPHSIVRTVNRDTYLPLLLGDNA